MTDSDPTDAATVDDDSDGAGEDAGATISLANRLRSHVTEHKTGMLHDLMFAVAWVGIVSFLFDFVFVSAPTWTFYMFMLAGIPAYFGFFISLEIAREAR